jgi:uncharacterized protein YjbI with pentapeptide repeats
MAWKYISYEYPYALLFHKMLTWVDKEAHCYYTLQESDTSAILYYGGNASHALATGSKLTNYASEAEARTNYLTLAAGRNLGVLPLNKEAKYVKVYIETGSTVQVHEFRPSTYFVANEIISGTLDLTDQLAEAPLITVTKGGIQRLKIGNFADTTYGMIGYDGDSNMIFELSDAQQVIGGWNISPDGLSIEDGISIDSAEQRISSGDYVENQSGWKIDSDVAEFNNIVARGRLKVTVFEKDTVNAVNGIFVVSQSDVLATDMMASDASTLTIDGNTTFALNDVLHIKDGVDDEYLLVTDISAAPTYTVTRDRALQYPPNTNPTWKKGTAVISEKTTGGGFIVLDASSTNNPYLQVWKRTGTTWNQKTEYVRIGNLKGFLSEANEVYGIGIGDVSGYLKYDPDNGMRIAGSITATTGWIGGWKINETSIYTGVSEDHSGYTGSSGDLTIYSNGTDASIHGYNFYIGTDGKLVCRSATIGGAITPGADSVIDGQYLTNATIVGAKLVSGTITATQIANATITATQIANATITATQIANATITGTQIANATISGSNIGAATITGANIGAATIAGSNIGAATIAGSNIASATITGANIAGSTIAASNIANGTITATQISGTAGITGGQIAVGTITGNNIASTTITAGLIANLTITASQIANLTINGEKIANGAVTAAKTTIPMFIVGSGTIADNYPSAGYVGWTSVVIVYNGTSYAITNSNTNKRYIIWNSSSPTALSGSDSVPTTDTIWLVGMNTSGTYLSTWDMPQVHGEQIQSGTITGSQIATATIVGGNIANGTISGVNIGTGTITSDNILNGTITGADIGTATITGANIGSGTIAAGNITNATITTTQISNSAGITGTQIANNTIAAANIVNGTITATQIANATITATQIANNTITANQIANLTITANQIANLTVTSSQIANSTITTTQISEVNVSKLSTGQITSKEIELTYTGSADCFIRAGTKTGFATTGTGFILGIDAPSGLGKLYIGDSTSGGSYLAYDGTDVEFCGEMEFYGPRKVGGGTNVQLAKIGINSFDPGDGNLNPVAYFGNYASDCERSAVVAASWNYPAIFAISYSGNAIYATASAANAISCASADEYALYALDNSGGKGSILLDIVGTAAPTRSSDAGAVRVATVAGGAVPYMNYDGGTTWRPFGMHMKAGRYQGTGVAHDINVGLNLAAMSYVMIMVKNVNGAQEMVFYVGGTSVDDYCYETNSASGSGWITGLTSTGFGVSTDTQVNQDTVYHSYTIFYQE